MSHFEKLVNSKTMSSKIAQFAKCFTSKIGHFENLPARIDHGIDHRKSVRWKLPIFRVIDFRFVKEACFRMLQFSKWPLFAKCAIFEVFDFQVIYFSKWSIFRSDLFSKWHILRSYSFSKWLISEVTDFRSDSFWKWLISKWSISRSDPIFKMIVNLIV